MAYRFEILEQEYSEEFKDMSEKENIQKSM